MWNFKGNLWNSTQNILPIHWKIWFLCNIEILRALGFDSSWVCLKRPRLWYTRAATHCEEWKLYLKVRLISYPYPHDLCRTCHPVFLLWAHYRYWVGGVYHRPSETVFFIFFCFSFVFVRRRSNKTPKLCVTGLCEWNPLTKGQYSWKCFHLMTSSSCRSLLQLKNDTLLIV